MKADIAGNREFMTDFAGVICLAGTQKTEYQSAL